MTYNVQQHIVHSRVSDFAAAPCGTWLAVALQRLDREGTKYVSDIWKLPTDGSAAVQLTRGDSRDSAPCFRHDGCLAFLSNRQPTEIKPDEEAEKRNQVWILPGGGGEPKQLTDEPLGIHGFRFAKRAPRVAYFASVIAGVEHEQQREFASKRAKNGPSARHFTTQPVRHWDAWLHENADMPNTHLITCDADGENRIDLTPDAQREFAIDPSMDVSADGKWVIATRLTLGKDRETDSTLLLVDVQSKSTRILGVADHVNFESPVFSPDGRHIAAVRMTRSPVTVFRPLIALFDIADGKMRQIGEKWDRWPNQPQWSVDGQKLFVTADDSGHTPIFSIDVANEIVERISSIALGGTHSNLNPLEDGRIGGIRSTLLDAPECFVIESTPGATPKVLSNLSGFHGAHEWAEVESFSIPSTDGTPIQSFLVKPKGATTDNTKRPLLFWIHGGPIGMVQDGWHWRWNPLLMVAQGYAVALPNPRGSTGFGQKFVQGIWGNVWGGQCYKDLIAVADALDNRPDIDASRTMAMGGSFGGYMANWIGTQTDRFKCLITHASIATMAQFTGTTDHPAWWYLEMGGENPYADMAQFDRYAPIRYIDNWKTPVLIIHGERDYRCPINEALNLFEALQYHGVKSELLVFPDEGHWIAKPLNIVAWYQTVVEFIGRHLHQPST